MDRLSLLESKERAIEAICLSGVAVWLSRDCMLYRVGVLAAGGNGRWNTSCIGILAPHLRHPDS